MADGKQCDRCKEWEQVEDGELLPPNWTEATLPFGLSVYGSSNLDLCAPCSSEFVIAKDAANAAGAKAWKERFWPK